ncbi:uncharacterized protein LAJ45_05297 [Morchella importuna]|uniref:Uncharacterized protein n=1 Tax=Morchella conica CCBAS932 TaxID=1392247 RepID=A0A3N4KYP8_9PEZI|nr:uncharacterized protein LAJ45_05297 [Morchella importuna]KAH8150601.1 hypothetical protein LAJ45_05297 [Morchella importuna]RPB14588.1 hypothetical protein P167DRAFT_534012 [Morchella conica CCBAS932]
MTATTTTRTRRGRASSLESLSTTKSYDSSLTVTVNTSTRSSAHEHMGLHSSSAPLQQKKARFAENPCTGTYYTHNEKSVRKQKKNVSKKFLKGAKNALGFCCWLLCASCVLSGPEYEKWNSEKLD